MALHYDPAINAGHIMTAGVILCSVIGAVIWVQADLTRISSEQQRFEAAMTTEIVSIRSDAQSRETRLRAAELALAGQAGDLRAIQASLGRIERLLEAQE